METTLGDHIFGLIPLMASLLNGAGGVAAGGDDPRLSIDTTKAVRFCVICLSRNCIQLYPQALEIYGPLGTRAYVRNGLAYTYTNLGASYVVHELRFPTDPPSGDHTALAPPISECAFGRNIAMGDDGCWGDIYKDNTVSVSAAPIYHSVPCVGFTVTEAPVPGKIDPAKYKPDLLRTKTPMSVMRTLQKGESVTLNDGTVLHGPPRRPGRKIVILGDTYDPSPMVPISEDADLLIHEATNAHLPGIDPTTKDSETYESVEERTKSRGHSTPQMAGTFAKRIRARRLILNHFSARYPGDNSEESKKIMGAIGQLAEKEFGKEVLCATDLMSADVSFNEK
jgi:ribonuclease Z